MNVLGFIYGKYRNYTIGEEVEIVSASSECSIRPYKVGDVCTVVEIKNKKEYATLCKKRTCDKSSIKQCLALKINGEDREVWTCYCDVVPYRKR